MTVSTFVGTKQSEEQSLTRKMSKQMGTGIPAVYPLFKTIRKRGRPKYKGRYSKSSRVRQITRLTQRRVNHFQPVDLVKFVKQRRAFTFEPYYTTDDLFNIFDKVRFEL
jgi:hypothetical protein